MLQVAVAFAEMHDTPVRMMAKKVLHGIVPWQKARSFLTLRLRRRCDTLRTVWCFHVLSSAVSSPVPA